MFQFHVCIFHYFICTFALVAIRTQGQSLLLREEPKVHSELLKEDEGEDGLRAETDEGWDVALVEGQRTLLQGCLEHIHRAGKFSWENGNDQERRVQEAPGLAFMDRVFRTSSGWVIVVAMAPWKKNSLQLPVLMLTAPRLEVK